MNDTLQSLSASTVKVNAVIPVQVSNPVQRETANGGKPFYDITISDASHTTTVKLWSDTAAFTEVKNNTQGGFYFLEAGFQKNEYGLNLSGPTLRPMSSQEKDVFLSGGGEAKAVADREWDEIYTTASAITIEPLRIVLLSILDNPRNQSVFRRSAAARKNHHARRGGLVSHTASMLRVARAVAPLYPDVSPSLLFAGVIMHDSVRFLKMMLPTDSPQPNLFLVKCSDTFPLQWPMSTAHGRKRPPCNPNFLRE